MENEAGTQTSSPSNSPAPDKLSNTSHKTSRLGTIIPNRIFVGAIDVRTNENDLRRFFSQLGKVREVKIVTDRAGVSKGYGFVTFESQEDAQKILHDANRLYFRDKRLNIGQAFRKQQVEAHCSYTMPTPGPSVAHPSSFGTMYLTTPTGYPYTYHNGVAYFHTLEPNTNTSHWHAPNHTLSGSSLMMTHSASSICTPQPYHPCQASSQYMSGHVPWTIPQVEALSAEYQAMEIPAENGYVQSAIPLMEATIPEQVYLNHMVQLQYPICMQGQIIPSQDAVKEQKFYPLRRSYSHSGVHLKPRYYRGPHYTYLHKNYQPDLSQPSPAPALAPASAPASPDQEMLK